MNVAVITETRYISNIGSVIRDHLQFLPGYDLIIFHGSNNEVLFKGLKGKRFTVNINNLHQYNALMTSTEYWNKLLSYDRVLIFQHESMILRDGIEEFYEWDYVGAPWKFQLHGGNGGLSLRNPKIMYETLTRIPYNPTLGYEDVYFCNHMKGNLAPREVCEKFSCETIYKLGTLGYHAIDNYLNKQQCNEIKDQYKRNRGVSSRFIFI